jgi:transcriptional regulator with XRE-family HTH domain
MARKHDSLTAWLDDLRRERGFDAEVTEALHEFRLADDLVRLREARGLSQRDLAAKLGISQPAIAKIESGRAANLQLKTLVRFVTALGGELVLGIRDTEGGRSVGEPQEELISHATDTFDLEAMQGSAVGGVGSLTLEPGKPLSGQVIPFKSRVA